MENNPKNISADTLLALINALSEAKFTMQAVAQALNSAADDILCAVADFSEAAGLNVDFISLMPTDKQEKHSDKQEKHS